jgi:mannan endo-1,4-beta-mannosidase
MNGDWFWWGKKPGPDGYRRLYRMLFDRFVNFHGLDNLLWVYNANEIRANVDPYATHYPGADVVDILATDVYQNGFAQADYQQLSALAQGKPIALGEVGQPPGVDVLKKQPRWAWFMLWGDLPPRGRPGSPDFSATYESPETLTHDELPWVKVKDPQLHYPILK